jgi:hypothetical protein
VPQGDPEREEQRNDDRKADEQASHDNTHSRPSAFIRRLLDSRGFGWDKPLKTMALPSGIEPLSPP